MDGVRSASSGKDITASPVLIKGCRDSRDGVNHETDDRIIADQGESSGPCHGMGRLAPYGGRSRGFGEIASLHIRIAKTHGSGVPRVVRIADRRSGRCRPGSKGTDAPPVV